jgi:hypothetical protein
VNDTFKNGFKKKGVDNFYLSNDTNKSITHFRETIPLKSRAQFSIRCTALCS